MTSTSDFLTANPALLIALAALLVGISWVLVAAGTAIGSLTRTGVSTVRERAPRRATRLECLVEEPAKYANAALLAHTIITIAAFALLALALIEILPWTWWVSLVLATALMGAVVFVLLGVSARTIGAQHPYGVASLVSGPIRLLTFFIHPFVFVLIQMANAITPGKGSRTGPFTSQEELREMVDAAGAEVIADDERLMIHSVFALGGTIVREVMVPRTEMVMIESTKSLRQAMSLALRSGFSRIPVIGEGPDDVVGVAFLKDMMRRSYEYKKAEQEDKTSDIMRGVHYVPDSKPVDELLKEMQANREHMAIVVDEYGGTAGLVTIEDILEEIVGDIADEYDTSSPDIERLEDGAMRVSARLSLEHLTEATDLKVDPDAERVETVGGLMALRLGRVPIPGAEVVEEGWILKAESGKGRRNQVATILVRPQPEQGVTNE